MSRIYFYHTLPTHESYEEWKQKKFPGHFLYGMPLLDTHGIQSVLHRFKPIASRWKLMLYTAKEILFSREKFDAIYGTSFRGLEIIIFLRALGLYRKPIIVWHHTSLVNCRNSLRELGARLFYRGIDHMFFFSRKLIADSILTGKAPASKMQLVHWGPDVDFYDHLLQAMPPFQPEGFISTGKENRDVETLLNAFAATDEHLELYIAPKNLDVDYQQIISSLTLPDTIEVHYTSGLIPLHLAQKVATKKCIVICCLDFHYTVGLTTLVEAFALGIPVICSRNPNFEMDIDKEGAGITVEYGDVEGWKAAIRRIADNPAEVEQMKKNARRLADEHYNLKILSREIAEGINAVL